MEEHGKFLPGGSIERGCNHCWHDNSKEVPSSGKHRIHHGFDEGDYVAGYTIHSKICCHCGEERSTENPYASPPKMQGYP